MSKARKPLTAADLFCGAGGFTTGAAAAGVDVLLAVNHWRTAVFTHQANHPETRHICARIDDVDPRNDKTLPACDLLMASPECTHHSIARGGRPIDDQKRATPWHVCVWAEARRPKWILVENVREFRDWGPLRKDGRPDKRCKGQTFRAWIRSIESLGYQVDHQLLNAADFGAATSRTRLFVVCRRGHRRADIPWPDPPYSKDQWRPAHEIIDWAKPCPSIFGRKRPLAVKTLARIEAGLRRFVGEPAEPFVVMFRNNQDAAGIRQPLTTICTSGAHHGLAVPFQLKAMGRNPGATKPIDTPLPTIVASRKNHAVVTPFLCTLTHGGRLQSLTRPMPTITTANRGEHSLVVPFLTKYYGTGTAASIDEPLDTVTTKDRFGLAMVSLLKTCRELGVVDIGFRMLGVDELVAAQGFPSGYHLCGTKAEQVRQVGNAVCPPVAEALCRTIGEAA